MPTYIERKLFFKFFLTFIYSQMNFRELYSAFNSKEFYIKQKLAFLIANIRRFNPNQKSINLLKTIITGLILQVLGALWKLKLVAALKLQIYYYIFIFTINST